MWTDEMKDEFRHHTIILQTARCNSFSSSLYLNHDPTQVQGKLSALMDSYLRPVLVSPAMFLRKVPTAARPASGENLTVAWALVDVAGRAKAANWLLPSCGQRTSTPGPTFHNSWDAGHHCLKSFRGMTLSRFHTFPCEMQQAMLEDGLQQGWVGHGRVLSKVQ